MREPNDESPRRFRLVGAPTPADPDATQPQQVIADTGARACFRRRHDTQIAEAREAGRREACEAAAKDTPSAFVPENFQQMCRSGGRTTREVLIVGVRVTVVPSRHCSDPDPDAELVAWEALRAAVTMKAIAAASGRECEIPPLPRQVAAAYWQDANGNQLRITADHSSLGWLRHRLGRPGGVASIVPIIGVGGGKLLAATVLTVGVVAVVAAPDSSVPHAAESVHPRDIVEEFVPSLDGWATTPQAKPRKHLLKQAPGTTKADPAPQTEPAPASTAHPAPIPQTAPVVPIDPPVSESAEPEPQASPSVEASAEALPSEPPRLPVEVPTILDAPTD